MKLRLPMMALVVASLAAFGCGESDDGSTALSADASGTSVTADNTSSAEAPSNNEIATDDGGLASADAAAAPPSAGLSESAGAPGPSPQQAPSAERTANGPAADSAAAEPGFAAEAEAGEADSAADEDVAPEEPMVEEVQWIQLSTDDSTSMASAQIYKSGQFLSGGLKVHEFINYYDPPHSLFAAEEFAETRDVDESIRFGIKADYVALEVAEEPATEEEVTSEETPTETEEVPTEDGETTDEDGATTDDEPEPDVVEPEMVPEPIEVEAEVVHGELEVLFQMQSDPTIKAERRNWNLFLCVDVSGSMRGEKMEFTIEALLKTLDHLKAGDRLTLTTFSSDAANIFTDLEFAENQAEIREGIQGLTPGGGTNMTAGLQQSYRLAQQNFDVNMLQRVLLFGDGAANVGQTDIDTFTSLTRINGSEGIYLSGIGVGTNYDFERMDQLTDAGKGAHIFLPNREEVDLIFGDYFAKLVEVAGDGIEIEASLPTGIALAAFSGEEVSFNPQQRLQNIVLATGDDMTFTAKFNVLDEAALDEPMSLKVTIRPLSTDEKVIEIIEVDSIRDLIATPGRLFERTRLVHRFGTFASGGDEDVAALRADVASYADPDWGMSEILTLLDR